jgi:hypothetical protein
MPQSIDNIETAWRAGFTAGAEHGDLPHKYPPEDVAWIEHKESSGLGIVTDAERAFVALWYDADYVAKRNANQWGFVGPVTRINALA